MQVRQTSWDGHGKIGTILYFNFACLKFIYDLSFEGTALGEKMVLDSWNKWKMAFLNFKQKYFQSSSLEVFEMLLWPWIFRSILSFQCFILTTDIWPAVCYTSRYQFGRLKNFLNKKQKQKQDGKVKFNTF